MRLLLLWLLIAGSCGCGGAQAGTDIVTAAHQADEKAFATEELACVATSATANEALDCIADVQRRWCGIGAPLAVLGACGDSGLLTQSTVDAMQSVADAIAVANSVMADGGRDAHAD